MRHALAGQREAYEEIVARCTRRVAAACWARLGRRDLVPDMVQETFLRGFRALGTLRNPARVRAWLEGIAIRVCLDWLKSPA